VLFIPANRNSRSRQPNQRPAVFFKLGIVCLAKNLQNGFQSIYATEALYPGQAHQRMSVVDVFLADRIAYYRCDLVVEIFGFLIAWSRAPCWCAALMSCFKAASRCCNRAGFSAEGVSVVWLMAASGKPWQAAHARSPSFQRTRCMVHLARGCVPPESIDLRQVDF
jgi:hypothetical protein